MGNGTDIFSVSIHINILFWYGDTTKVKRIMMSPQISLDKAGAKEMSGRAPEAGEIDGRKLMRK